MRQGILRHGWEKRGGKYVYYGRSWTGRMRERDTEYEWARARGTRAVRFCVGGAGSLVATRKCWPGTGR